MSFLKRIIKLRVISGNFHFKQIRNVTAKLNELKENEISEKKPKKKRIKSTEFKPAKDIYEYFNTPEKEIILKQFPEKFLRKKTKAPEHLYIANENIAKTIVKYLITDIPEEKPILEVNPGLGYLTKELLKSSNNKLLLFEANDKFAVNLKEQSANHQDRITVQEADFLALWKLVFQDKLDNGGRIVELLWNVPRKEWEEDTNVRIFANIGSMAFLKHLINSFIFQNSLLSYGRCELFLCLPPPLYINLTCSNKAGYLMYRSTSVLFQLLFEHEFLEKIPRRDFLPWQTEFKFSSSLKLTKYNLIDPDYLYLVKVIPRRDFFQHCQPQHLPALWFFVKQNLVSRKNRVIPALERFIPNCGPRLIVSNKFGEVKNLNSTVKELPLYSEPAKTISNQSAFKDITIFTQFGDLTPSEILTVFDDFVSWPEYKQCPFIPSLENSLLKLETSPDESTDNLDLQEVDDVEITDTSKKN